MELHLPLISVDCDIPSATLDLRDALGLETEQDQIAPPHSPYKERPTETESVTVFSDRQTFNALRSPNLLPDELLAEIMGIAYGYHYQDEDFEAEYWPPLCFSHVCSRWRRVALSTPSLWSNIPLGKLGVASSFLERTNGALIDAKSSSPLIFDPKTFYNMARFLHDHASQLRSLQLRFGGRSPLSVVAHGLARTRMPRLQCLSLAMLPHTEDLSVLYHLSRLFDKTSPPLRRASFLDVPVPLSSPLLRGGELRYLKISGQTVPDIDGLLTVLRLSPYLVELHLRGTDTSNSFPTPIHPTSVHLPNLQLMSIEDLSIHIVSFLENFDTPAGIRISRTDPGWAVDQHPEGFHELLSNPCRRLRRLHAFHGNTIRSATVRHRRAGFRRLEFSISYHRGLSPASFDYISLEGDQPQLNIAIEYASHDSESWGPATFSSIGNSTGFPLPNLQSIHFSHIHRITDSDGSSGWAHRNDSALWRTVFSALPALETLVLDQCSFDHPMLALTTESETGALRCLRLHTISLIICTEPELSLDAARKGFTALTSCIAKRRGAASQLRVLSIHLAEPPGMANIVNEFTPQLDRLARSVWYSRAVGDEDGSNSRWRWEF